MVYEVIGSIPDACFLLFAEITMFFELLMAIHTAESSLLIFYGVKTR